MMVMMMMVMIMSNENMRERNNIREKQVMNDTIVHHLLTDA